MSQEDRPSDEGQVSDEPLTSPGAGYGADETLPAESGPVGAGELAKDDVGFEEPGQAGTPPADGEQ